MFVIWAKILDADKRVAKNILYKKEETYSGKKFHEYLTEICSLLDAPTPVLMKAHVSNFEIFNLARFRARDFVEPIFFDELVLERAQ